jgi:hypothetical protein
MKRILYFTGYRMVAQEWSGSKLSSSVYFEPDDQGLDLFAAYLASLKSEPVRLLVDLIEEEFRQVKIPLLRGRDRQEMLSRNFAKFFRNSDYRHAVTQSIEKKGRKEERILMMGLTNQYLLKPWLEIIHKTRTPLIGIMSLPLVSEGLVSRLKDQNRCVILVSQQVPSNLRQSVFLNGKLILSRLVPIASFYQGDYASDVIRDVESTQRYLISQRIIERSDTISVNILCNERHRDKLLAKREEGGFFDYQIHTISEVIASEKIQIDDQQDFSSVLFCHQALRKPYANHYARSQEKLYFYHFIGALTTKLVSIFILALGLGLSATSVVKGMIFDSSVTEMKMIEQKYVTKYNQLAESRVDPTTSTTNMRDIVQLVDKIEKGYLARPRDMMIKVSEHISLFANIRLREYDWFISNDKGADSIREVNWGVKDPRQRRRGAPVRQSKELFEIVVVSGEFVDFNGDFRYVLSAIDDLESAMKSSGYYDEVIVLKRPLDVESNNQLSGEVGVLAKKTIGNAPFQVRLVRKVPLS